MSAGALREDGFFNESSSQDLGENDKKRERNGEDVDEDEINQNFLLEEGQVSKKLAMSNSPIGQVEITNLERKLDDFCRSMDVLEDKIFELESKITHIEAVLNSNGVSKAEWMNNKLNELSERINHLNGISYPGLTSVNTLAPANKWLKKSKRVV